MAHAMVNGGMAKAHRRGEEDRGRAADRKRFSSFKSTARWQRVEEDRDEGVEEIEGKLDSRSRQRRAERHRYRERFELQKERGIWASYFRPK